MRTNVRKPNGILYFIVYIFLYPFLKVFVRLDVDRSGLNLPDGPFVMLSNHQSFMDFLLAMLTVYPRRLNAVTAQKFFFYQPLNMLLPLMGCIPKYLFDPDIRSIKAILSVIKRGGGVLLFPEGRCSVDGGYMGMHKSTGKLIKKLEVPVISCRIEGAYICMPFWRKGVRPGRVRVTLANLFTPKDAADMPLEEINSRIDERLSGEDAAMPTAELGVFRDRRLAEGLENVIYYCPNCGGEFTLETKGNIIKCNACLNEAAVDRALKITPARGCAAPADVRSWYKMQAEYEMKSLSNGMDPIKTSVIIRMPLRNGKGVEPCGRGTLRLEPDGWHFDGELSGQPAELFFPIGTVSAIPFDPNDDFQIYSHGDFYMFTPENPRACSKYATVGECAYWRFASPVQMTRGFCMGALKE